MLSSTNGKRGQESTAKYSVISGSPAGIHAEIHYNPFTAADEKVPLSVVLVNKKPQHLVFCLFLGHPLSKQRGLPVESSRHPCGTRISGTPLCLKFGAGSTSMAASRPTSKPSPRRGDGQDAETVQFWGLGCADVEIGGRILRLREWIGQRFKQSLEYQFSVAARISLESARRPLARHPHWQALPQSPP